MALNLPVGRLRLLGAPIVALHLWASLGATADWRREVIPKGPSDVILALGVDLALDSADRGPGVTRWVTPGTLHTGHQLLRTGGARWELE